MTSTELQQTLFTLLDEIDLAIGEDLVDETPILNGKETVSYAFYIRVTEIFQAIVTLIKTDQVIPATILLRSLSEAYILMKSSVLDGEFNDRHIKQSAAGQETFLSKVMEHLSRSGFPNDPKLFEELKAEALALKLEFQKGLQTTNDLFFNNDEHMAYIQIYAPASLYVHSNRQSFNVYHSEGNGIKPIGERDYSGIYKHTGLSAALLMLKAYKLFCSLIKKQKTVSAEIEIKMEICASKLLTHQSP
ncbi:MAG: hypothetical protein EOP06_01130 [Proteobacteria bacterium]|nr:MAG: hypothetical protein EOP06_01130 [Pseudomonadota bacterium]